MSNFELTLPSLSVDVEVASGSFVVIRQPTTTLNRSAIPIQNVAEMAITSSYAVTASHALNATTVLPNGVVSSSQQIISYNRFATTASNMFYGNQDIIGAFGDINVNIDEFEPHIEVMTSNGGEDAEYHTYQLFHYTTSSGFFGFTLDSIRAGYSGWNGPGIGGDDGNNNYPIFIGFQDASNYTDGTVAVLTPLSASSGITGSLRWVDVINKPTGLISSSAQISQSGFVSSSTINTIQTITSASYAVITPVSGTLYIIID